MVHDESKALFCFAQFLRARIYSTLGSYSLSYSFADTLRSILPVLLKPLRFEERVGIAYQADLGAICDLSPFELEETPLKLFRMLSHHSTSLPLSRRRGAIYTAEVG